MLDSQVRPVPVEGGVEDGMAVRDAKAVAVQFPPARVAWRSVILLTALYSLSLMDRQLITLLVVDIRADLGVSDFQMGLLHGLAFALFYVTFGLAFGWAVDRYPRRAIIFLGVVFWSLATAAGGLARNFSQLLGARFGVGAGEASLNPAAYSIIADSFPKHRRAVALSVFGSGSYLGGAFAVALGALLIDSIPADGLSLPFLGHLPPWRIALIAVGLPGLVLAFLVWGVIDPPRQERRSNDVVGLRDALVFIGGRWRFFACHFIGFGLLAANAYAFGAWTPTYLIRKFELSIALVGLFSSTIVLVFGMGGTVFSGWLIDKLFARGRTDIHLRFYIFCAAAQIAVLFAAAATDSLPLFLALNGTAMFLASYTGAAVAALQIATPNEFRGQVSAIYLFVFTLLGIGLGPTLIGAITTFVFRDDMMLGWAIATGGAILLPLAMLALFLGLGPMRRAVIAAQEWSDEGEESGA
ncbi:MAG: MFS transporter [Novosphingobium sp.]|nr:MFS transporter [Novosphingobium sp.]